LGAQPDEVVEHLLAGPLERLALPAGVAVDKVDEAAHEDPHGTRVAPTLAGAVAHRLDGRADLGEVLPAVRLPITPRHPTSSEALRRRYLEVG